jgi:sugar/nucleoside kinase (ribokinase family)
MLSRTDETERGIQFKFFGALPANAVNVLGAGDCFNAGVLLAHYAKRLPLFESIPWGLAAGKLSVESHHAVPENLTLGHLETYVTDQK